MSGGGIVVSSASARTPMTRVLVLGAEGMLGSMVARVLARHPRVEVVPTTRHGDHGTPAFEVERDSIADLVASSGCEWIVNAIGVLDRGIDERDPRSVAAAIEVNARFPHLLLAAARGQRIINVATDGVFSGRHAPYDEHSAHDADGVYARSKSLGELRSRLAVNLRCSIIGPERPPPTSLLGWALTQPSGAAIAGYTDHRWNGVTSLHFAKVCTALVVAAPESLPATLHVVPEDSVTKAELLGLALAAFGRSDVTVVAQPGPRPVDRTLGTVHEELNRRLWAAAGYRCPPRIAEMLEELAEFDG
jgi:dTDP-4-dehydrorhamnose reductase